MRESGRAVVTGGAGFIGTHLVRRLVALGRPVAVLDDMSNGRPDRLPPGVDVRVGDVTDPEHVRAAVEGAAVVFHLAAVASVEASNERWLASHATNSGGIVAVMEAIRELAPQTPVVYASSAAVYGDPAVGDGERVGEGTAVRPLTPYGADKWASEQHARVGGSLFGIRSCGVRFFNVYGPGQAADSPYSGVVSKFIAQAEAGGPVTIQGDGRQSRDFIHVADAVEALIAAQAAACPEAPVVNICTGREISIADLAATVVRLAAPSAEIRHVAARPGDIRRSVGDPSLAERLLGWRAAVDLETGLRKLIAER